MQFLSLGVVEWKFLFWLSKKSEDSFSLTFFSRKRYRILHPFLLLSLLINKIIL